MINVLDILDKSRCNNLNIYQIEKKNVLIMGNFNIFYKFEDKANFLI